jgi:F-type H+-transporting ATPase subunit delta
MAAIAGRYARAFVEVILDMRLDPGKALQELNDMAGLIQANGELKVVLENPAVNQQQKLRLVDAIIARLGGSRPLRNFVAVLVDHRRIGQIHEIAQQFRQELNERLGIAEANVTSARELTRDEKELLQREMAFLTGKKVETSYSRDPDLLGGAVVRIGSTIYDGSVRGQLRRIREQITAG